MNVPIKNIQVTECHHCGNTCDNGAITQEQHVFCCNGCSTVFQLLKDSQLENYYTIEHLPGIKPEDTDTNFDFLELPEVISKVVQYKDDALVKMRLFVPDIHCASCIYLLENLSKIDQEIISSRVNFSKKELTISANNKEQVVKRVFRLLQKLGYKPNLERDDRSVDDDTSRSLLIQLGIAGFCFGNIMLLSIPGYLSAQPMSPKLQATFLIVSILLTIPVLVFGARDYYLKAYKSLRQKYLSIEVPIALGITALLLNSLLDILLYQGNGYLDSLAGLIFFLLIGKWIQAKTYQQFSFEKDIRSFFPLAVQLKKGKDWVVTRVIELKENDIILLRHGEILPVNAQLLDAQGSFDYSFVTGESQSVKKSKGDLLYAGGKLISASSSFKVINKMDQSYFSELWQNQSPPTEKGIKDLLDKVSHYFTLTIITIALAGGLYWLLTDEIQKALFVFTSTLIVACPCALALAMPFTYGSADRILGANGIYLKHFRILEFLEKINTVVLDKTGTLTRSNSNEVRYNGMVLSEKLKSAFHAITSASIHPLSQAISAYLNIKHEQAIFNSFEEESGKGIIATFEKDDDIYYVGSLKFLIERGLEFYNTAHLNIGPDKSTVFIGRNHEIIGAFEIGDKYRPGIEATIEQLKKKFKVVVLSGDNAKKALPLKNLLVDEDHLLFEQTPKDKLDFIKREKINGRVMMVGDGINDAAALKESDVGISIIEQSGHFTPSSDIIMKGEKVKNLPTLLQYARDCQKVLYLGLGVSFVYNSVGIYFAFNGWLSPFVAAILMPISSITVVALSTTLTYALAKKRNLAL